jgi:hypothetical protein
MPAPASAGAAELPIEVVPSVVCPTGCFIGNRRRACRDGVPRSRDFNRQQYCSQHLEESRAGRAPVREGTFFPDRRGAALWDRMRTPSPISP